MKDKNHSTIIFLTIAVNRSSGVARVGVTRCDNEWWHPLFFVGKIEDLSFLRYYCFYTFSTKRCYYFLLLFCVLVSPP